MRTHINVLRLIADEPRRKSYLAKELQLSIHTVAKVLADLTRNRFVTEYKGTYSITPSGTELLISPRPTLPEKKTQEDKLFDFFSKNAVCSVMYQERARFKGVDVSLLIPFIFAWYLKHEPKLVDQIKWNADLPTEAEGMLYSRIFNDLFMTEEERNAS